MKLQRRRILLATLAFLPALAWAGAVDQLHKFLDSTRTYRAEFSQLVTGKAGKKPQQSSGTVSISRPGKLRWEIQKPYPQTMVGDGEKFWIYDPELKQVTVRKAGKALGASPLALLAGDNELDKNFILKEGGESEGLAWVDAQPRATDTGFESVRLGFAGGELKAMELKDNFGQTTHLRFTKGERNPSLPASHFKFTPPAGADVVGE